jgi:hypothetical protein
MRSLRLPGTVIVVVALCGAVLALLWLPVGASAVADAAPVFTADTPPPFQLDEVNGSDNSCGSGCSYNNQIGYAFAARGSPVPTYSVSSGALPAGMDAVLTAHRAACARKRGVGD